MISGIDKLRRRMSPPYPLDAPYATRVTAQSRTGEARRPLAGPRRCSNPPSHPQALVRRRFAGRLAIRFFPAVDLMMVLPVPPAAAPTCSIAAWM